MKHWALVAVALVAGAAPAQNNLISGGSGNPQSGSAKLDYLTVGAIDAGVVMAGKDAAASTCAIRIPNNSDVRMCLGASNQFQFSFNGGSGLSDVESSGQVRFLSGGNIANSSIGVGSISIRTTLAFSGAVPTISSGFGTSPSVTAGYATAFRVNVGTGGTASSGVVALGATASNGWNCTCTDVTTANATVFLCKQTANTTTTVTVTNYDAAGAAAPWAASDILAVSCVGF